MHCKVPLLKYNHNQYIGNLNNSRNHKILLLLFPFYLSAALEAKSPQYEIFSCKISEGEIIARWKIRAAIIHRSKTVTVAKCFQGEKFARQRFHVAKNPEANNRTSNIAVEKIPNVKSLAAKWLQFKVPFDLLSCGKARETHSNMRECMGNTLVTSNVNYRECSLSKICPWERYLIFTPNCVNFIEVNSLREMWTLLH